MLNVAVDDAAGKPVLNLSREDFTILEDGEPRDIKSFEAVETPYHVLLLFDRSQSTLDQRRFLVRAISAFYRSDARPASHCSRRLRCEAGNASGLEKQVGFLAPNFSLQDDAEGPTSITHWSGPFSS
jgi:hypothetical protein